MRPLSAPSVTTHSRSQRTSSHASHPAPLGFLHRGAEVVSGTPVRLVPFAAGIGRILSKVLQHGATESEEPTTLPSAILPIQQPRKEIADCRSGHDPIRRL